MKAAASRRTPWTVTERRDDTSRTAGLIRDRPALRLLGDAESEGKKAQEPTRE
jgi:hypothetical protein